jgi:hypothetical protein
MNLREGYSYKDREGNIWDCYQHSVYDIGWSWCRNRNDRLPGLFTGAGYYTNDAPHPYDLVEEVGLTTSDKPFVVLEGIEEGNRFYTTNTRGEDHRFLANGTEAYRVLGFADTGDEARKIIAYRWS